MLLLVHSHTENILVECRTSGITPQHADNGYSRYVNLGDSVICSMVIIHLPDGTNVYGSRGGGVVVGG